MLGGEVLDKWQAGLDDMFALIAGCFSRVEPRRLAFAYIRGLLAPLERRNGWTLSEQAGRRSPNAMQEMLYSPCWDPGRGRDGGRDYLVKVLRERGGGVVGGDHGFCKQGGTLGRGAAAVLGHGREGGELPDWYLPCLRLTAGAGVDRPGVVSAEVVDPGCGPVRGGRGAQGRGVRDQTRAGEGDDRTGGRRSGAVRVVRRRRGFRAESWPA